MSTYTQILYQIVFGTKNHWHTLGQPGRPALFKYIAQVLRKKRCHVHAVNGVSNHVHIITDIHPSVALADIVKSIKLASSKYIKEQGLFPMFSGWQEGYGAFTYSNERKDILVNYVQNQEAHHAKRTFLEEYIELLNEHDIEFDVRYLT
jgi:REP element-mobilizing transposase RayT